MSGIYGFIRNENCMKSMPDTTRLALWNKAYGSSAHFEKKGNNYLMGCYVEKLHSQASCPDDMPVRDGRIWNIDVLLYNREEILDVLGDCPDSELRSASDEELIVELIERKGFEALAGVNGDFSGVVYDTDKGEIILFRDHMGVRPLYYYISDGCLCFSTDLRGVLAAQDVDVTINRDWAYRAYFGLIDYSSTSTEYEYIYCVRPASYLTVKFTDKPIKNRYASRLFNEEEYDYEVDDRQRSYWKCLKLAAVKEKKYWYLGSKKIRYGTEEEYCNKMRELVEDSVKRRLDSFDGLAGAEFSGGLDSSLISILIKKMGRDCVYASWSKDPEELPLADFDERRTIFDICDRYSIKCDFVSKIIRFGDFEELNERYSRVVDTGTDEASLEKYAFWPALNTLPLLNSASHISRNGGKVVFTGHGGDEGISHRANPHELIYNGEIKNYIDYYSNLRECKNFKRLRGIRRALRAYFQNVSAIRRGERRTEEYRRYENPYWQVINPEMVKWGRNLKKIPYTFGYDVKRYILRYGDRNRMDCVAVYGAYCGVRYMLPYLDYRLINYAVSIERGMYLKHGTDRYVLKNAFKDILPDRLLGEVDKRDPSYLIEHSEPVSPERMAAAVRERILDFKERYGISGVEGIFSLDDILKEMDAKEITANNIDELVEKCENLINTLRLRVIVDKARGTGKR